MSMAIKRKIESSRVTQVTQGGKVDDSSHAGVPAKLPKVQQLDCVHPDVIVRWCLSRLRAAPQSNTAPYLAQDHQISKCGEPFGEHSEHIHSSRHERLQQLLRMHAYIHAAISFFHFGYGFHQVVLL